MRCLKPFEVKDNSGEYVIVPCGNCPNCLRRRADGWMVRLVAEEKQSDYSQFITLTYDTSNLRFTNSGLPTISRREHELFFKRFRKANSGHKVKYFVCGEYGGKFERPHYHALLFGKGEQSSLYEGVCNSWQLGEVHFGKVEKASIGYCLKYMCKPSKLQRLKGDDRVREFACMSKGIGQDYMTEQMVKWHKEGNRTFTVQEGGKKVALPRYLKDRIFQSEESKALLKESLVEYRSALISQDKRSTWEIEQSVEAAYRRMFEIHKF